MESGPPGYPPQSPVLPESDKAAMVFVFGILSVVMCQPLGIFAWVMGRNEQQRVDAGLVAPNDLLKVGTILGIVGTALFCLWCLFALVWVGFLVLAIGAGAAGAAGGM